MADFRNLVVLGGSVSGLSVAHYFLKHIYPSVKTVDTSVKYRVVLVDPSTHFWWRISAPRAMVDSSLLPHSKTFLPIQDGFTKYEKDAITIMQGTATGVDFSSRTVNVELASSSGNHHTETIPYYALVIATGFNTPTPLTSIHGDHTKSLAALDDMNRQLTSAKEVVISGGGPVGVEAAGEIGEALNGTGVKPGISMNVKITLIAGSDKLLPVLRKALSEKAEKLLNRVGVEVVYNVKVTQVDYSGDKTIITLDNGARLNADVYLPATGGTPNTSFLPGNLLNDQGYVCNNRATLRVDHPDVGKRVYCIGDVGVYSRGGILDLFSAMPVLGANMAKDFGVAAPDRTYKANDGETQLVPIGRSKGVGAFNGWAMPAFAVKMIKGKDYMLGNVKNITHGYKWAKA